MVDLTIERVVEWAEHLTPEEKTTLIEQLQALQKTRAPLELLVFDVGPWPENLTLRREDEYGDDGR